MKSLDEMTDDEVLAAAGNMGPAMIGQALFDRAERVRKTNPTGALGPAILGESAPAPDHPFVPLASGATMGPGKKKAAKKKGSE